MRLFLIPVLLTSMLAAGCSSTPRYNRRIYDRYAQMVAERSRATSTTKATPDAEAATAIESTEKSPSSRAPVARAEPVAAKPTPKAKPAPSAKPVAKPIPAAKPPTPVIPAETPAPVPPPPVNVLTPSPAPVPPPITEPSAIPSVTEPQVDDTYDGVAYLLKQGDVVQVSLRGIPPNAEAIELIIDEKGMIPLPFINEVQAAGLTSSELARNIRQIYQDEGIYRNISVSIVVPTRYYFVQGEIRQPGRFQIVSATRISQAIAGAGGYTEFASGRVVIKRGGKIVKTIRNARRLERTPDDDIRVEPDDIIEVQRSLW